MSLNSNRLNTQVFFEELLGCSNPNDLKKFQGKATEILLNRDQSTKFRNFCEVDAKSFLFKGAISLLSAMNGLSKGRQTWPVVQLYYTNYYLLRSELLMQNRCTLRANKVFTILCNTREKIQKVSNKTKKSDHDLAIFFTKKYLDDTDILLSQNIDEDLPYEWLKKKRDWYQYRKGSYIEISDDGPFFSFEHINLLEQLNMYLSDSEPYFCFDPDYATLALPVKRFQLTLANAKNRSINLDNNAMLILKRFETECLACQRLLYLFKN